MRNTIKTSAFICFKPNTRINKNIIVSGDSNIRLYRKYIMHIVFLFFSLIVFFRSGTFAQTETIRVDGKNREYILHVPTNLPENPPLVLALHPLGVNNERYRSISEWDVKADEEHFIVVFPQGIYKKTEMGGLIGWDVYSDAGVVFLTTLLDTLTARFNIDRNRVYSTGLSMGGMMSYKLACSVADRITAIGTEAGYLLGEAPRNCTPSRPIPLCHIHGEDDDFVSYDGVEKWVKRFADLNGCQQTPETTTSSNYKKEDWAPCEKDKDVVFYTVKGMDHDHASFAKYNFSATDTFWTFFKKHALDETISTYNPVVERKIPQQEFSISYRRERIQCTGTREIFSIRIVDMLGKTIFYSKKHHKQPVNLKVPLEALPGRLGIVVINERSENIVRRILIP